MTGPTTSGTTTASSSSSAATPTPTPTPKRTTLNLNIVPLEDSLLSDIVGIQEVVDRLALMRKQEVSSTYKCRNYLADNQKMLKVTRKPVDAECRVKMVELCYQVVDFCKFRRETVAVAISYLDRFLSQKQHARHVLINRKEYQLVALTSLYIAVKLHEPLKIEASLLADLSRGCYEEEDFLKMEEKMLEGIQWRVCAPTQLGFCQLFLALLPDTVHSLVAETLMEYARYQIELVVADHAFVECRFSDIALAVVLNAVEGMDLRLFPVLEQAKYRRRLDRYAGVFVEDVEPLQAKLSMTMLHLVENFDFTSSQLAAAAAQAASAAAEGSHHHHNSSHHTHSSISHNTHSSHSSVSTGLSSASETRRRSERHLRTDPFGADSSSADLLQQNSSASSDGQQQQQQQQQRQSMSRSRSRRGIRRNNSESSSHSKRKPSETSPKSVTTNSKTRSNRGSRTNSTTNMDQSGNRRDRPSRSSSRRLKMQNNSSSSQPKTGEQ